MCIDQEMSKEKDSKSKHNPPNVVAKLMGLDTLPKGEPNLSVVRRSHREDYSKQFGDVDEGKMALIRRKFMEAKRLSTDERLRKSKQFGDALEVLSSNSDLLVRFLDSQKLFELPSTPPDESTKRITLVKPLKMVDNDKYAAAKGKKSKKPTNTDQETIWQNRKIPEYSSESPKFDDFSVQSTRIVLLKPSPGRTHEIKSLVSPTIPSPQSFYDDELESIKVAKEITRQMQEGLRSYQKDNKTLNSSVFSNGYTSDESSFNKSYHEDAAEKLSDLESMSPLTRHSWDCINGCRSPYSTVSLGRASCSPESSVCIEAKKRLSERWTMITSADKDHQEQKNVRRSSTLGEMLSLSLAKKHVSVKNAKDQEPSKSVSCSHSLNEEMSIDENSVPESSTDEKTNGSKVLTKSKSTKSSFKGKVANFLFSRNKKSTKKKSSSSKSKDEPQSTVTEISVLSANDVSQGLNVGGGVEECSLAAAVCESDSVSNGQQLHMITKETVSKPVVPEISISVLEPPVEDYNNTTHVGSHSQVALKSNLIDKSPPIESIARTLSWDDSCEDVAIHYPLKLKRISSLDTTTNIEEKEWFVLVQKLLSAAGLDDEEDYNRWHSIESPLEPSLRDTYANFNDKETQPQNEAKRRKIRSKQKLVFDCVNDALLEVVGYGSENIYFNRSLVQKGTFTLSPLLMDHIMAQMKELIANGMKWENCGDNHSLVVENVVKKEVMQIKLDELIRLEIDILGREIEGMLIQELVENVVIDFIA